MFENQGEAEGEARGRTLEGEPSSDGMGAFPVREPGPAALRAGTRDQGAGRAVSRAVVRSGRSLVRYGCVSEVDGRASRP